MTIVRREVVKDDPPATTDRQQLNTSRTASADNLSLGDLEGSIVVAEDGEALGLITTNCLDPNALCNSFSSYGNKFNANSILNEFGNYGNRFSEKSPFNEFTSTPPRIFKNGKFLAYLTINGALSPSVDPRWLLGALRMSR